VLGSFCYKLNIKNCFVTISVIGRNCVGQGVQYTLMQAGYLFIIKCVIIFIIWW